MLYSDRGQCLLMLRKGDAALGLKYYCQCLKSRESSCLYTFHNPILRILARRTSLTRFMVSSLQKLQIGRHVGLTRSSVKREVFEILEIKNYIGRLKNKISYVVTTKLIFNEIFNYLLNIEQHYNDIRHVLTYRIFLMKSVDVSLFFSNFD